MSVKKQLKNPLVQQYVLEILLPIVGYFFFDWSLTIIAAFYLIDFFSSEIARNRRVYKVYSVNEVDTILPFIISLISGIILFSISILWVWLMLSWYHTDYEVEMITELKAFAREELWLLLPIVYLVYHVKDVMTFYMPRKFMQVRYKPMVKFQVLELLILTILILSGTFIWQFFQLPDLVVLFGFVIIKIGFDILVARTLDEKYQS
ncbi:MAG: hypothetical protein R2780_06005 [Crocinitomicaceae bacterium]|nr:hypothetical protein [Crocinitomicaceae bacterium]